MNPTADALIRDLQLAPHPEGGFFRRVYESAKRTEVNGIERPALTAIKFLLPEGVVTRWHRVDADECWHWQQGGVLELRMLDPQARSLHVCRLGAAEAGEPPMQVVPAGWWQAARPLDSYTLVACTVSPGFVWDQFALMAADDPLADWLRTQGQWP